MKKLVTFALSALLIFGAAACGESAPQAQPVPPDPVVVGDPLDLPEPAVGSVTSLNQVLDARHSIRSFSDQPLSQEDMAALLWAAYGYRSDGGRTAPSAGGLYALSIFVAVGDVDGVPPGIYAWDPQENQLGLMSEGDPRTDLQAAALDQSSVGDAPATVVIAGSPARLAERYGNRAEQFTLNEAGHAAQNVLLMATALDLGSVAVGGFQDSQVSDVLDLPEREQPYYLLPVGHPAG